MCRGGRRWEARLRGFRACAAASQFWCLERNPFCEFKEKFGVCRFLEKESEGEEKGTREERGKLSAWVWRWHLGNLVEEGHA